MTGQTISFNDPEVQRCPFEAYRQVHAQGPVYLDPRSGFYVVVDYDEIKRAASDPATFSSVTGQLLVKDAPYQARIDAIYREHGFMPVNALVVADPPLHTLHRSLVDKAFTAPRVKLMEDYLETLVDSVIDAFIERGEVEFYGDMALMVPNYVISDQLGLPREEFGRFKRWADAVVQEGDPDNGEERQVEITHIICELHQYLVDKVEQLKKAPEPKILSDLVHAEVDGRRLSMEEIVAIVSQILPAGSDTTVSAMASMMYRMVTTAGLEARLRADRELIPSYIEEVLRLDAPVQGLYRRATRDVEIGGVPIPEGAIVVLKFGAGNRDPEQFPDPDVLDPKRPNARRNLTFGYGAHYCVGNQLARSELRISLNRLLDRMQNFRLTRGEDGVEWMAHFFAYGPTRLEISFDAVG